MTILLFVLGSLFVNTHAAKTAADKHLFIEMEGSAKSGLVLKHNNDTSTPGGFQIFLRGALLTLWQDPNLQKGVENYVQQEYSGVPTVENYVRQGYSEVYNSRPIMLKLSLQMIKTLEAVVQKEKQEKEEQEDGQKQTAEEAMQDQVGKAICEKEDKVQKAKLILGYDVFWIERNPSTKAYELKSGWAEEDLKSGWQFVHGNRPLEFQQVWKDAIVKVQMSIRRRPFGDEEREVVKQGYEVPMEPKVLLSFFRCLASFLDGSGESQYKSEAKFSFLFSIWNHDHGEPREQVELRDEVAKYFSLMHGDSSLDVPTEEINIDGERIEERSFKGTDQYVYPHQKTQVRALQLDKYASALKCSFGEEGSAAMRLMFHCSLPDA